MFFVHSSECQFSLKLYFASTDKMLIWNYYLYPNHHTAIYFTYECFNKMYHNIDLLYLHLH